MFDIVSVKLVSFRSYYGEHKFVFPTEPGLYSLTGINKLNERLGANDTGKTTLLEAIYWCFFGRTTGGIRGPDVISWGEQTCQVSVDCIVGGNRSNITRTQSPNSLVLGGVVVGQPTVEAHLRLGQDQFVYSVMLPQFGSSFFDLGPSEKLNLFSKIMGLDYWLERSEEAITVARTLHLDIDAFKLESVRLEAGIESALQNIEDCKLRDAKFKSDQKETLKKLRRRLQQTRYEADRLKGEFKQNQAAISKIKRKLETICAVCPTCKQPIPSDVAKSLQRNQRDFEADSHRIERALSSCGTVLTLQEGAVEEESNRDNPYKEMLLRASSQVDCLRRKVTEISKKINGLNADHAAVDFWVAGFKRVRLYVVESTLRQLEIKVNNNLTSLGLTDWEVSFDIERENKSGGITRGFTVFIKKVRGGSHPMDTGIGQEFKWESLSGGATQRLRLAGNLGLANLIMGRNGLVSNIEFYDEPSAHMSTAGIGDLLETLQQRARDEKKRIWRVDHHSLDFAFDGQLIVIKDEKGSHLTI